MTLPISQPNYFDSSEVGAPTLNNVAGSLLEVIRACAKNGFNAKTVTSIDVVSGVATANAASHGYSAAYGKLLLIEGCSDAALNGRKQPLSVDTNTFTYAAPGVADGTYTGTMSAKRAPLGWTEPHTGTNTAMFARSAAEATAMMLRVDDTAAVATVARAIIVETATGIDAYTGPAPTATQLSGGTYVQKGPNSATAKEWALVGCDRSFWLFTRADINAAPWNFSGMFFGDGVPYYPVDPYFCVLLAGATSTAAGNNAGRDLGINGTETQYGAIVSRKLDGTGEALRITQAGPVQGAVFGAANGGQVGANTVVIQSPLFYVETDGSFTVRGDIPGVAAPLARSPFAQLQVVTGVGEADKTMLSIRYTASNNAGNMLLDLTGPWY